VEIGKMVKGGVAINAVVPVGA
ncbi:MAG: hypothetical protein QOJ42_5720, partial [Acidobacteriaceae bacterium]|nr:hypothetical protein [Acidobacteriaceae bacterium]